MFLAACFAAFLLRFHTLTCYIIKQVKWLFKDFPVGDVNFVIVVQLRIRNLALRASKLAGA